MCYARILISVYVIHLTDSVMYFDTISGLLMIQDLKFGLNGKHPFICQTIQALLVLYMCAPLDKEN